MSSVIEFMGRAEFFIFLQGSEAHMHTRARAHAHTLDKLLRIISIHLALHLSLVILDK